MSTATVIVTAVRAATADRALRRGGGHLLRVRQEGAQGLRVQGRRRDPQGLQGEPPESVRRRVRLGRRRGQGCDGSERFTGLGPV